jgi:hypothetical protein
LAACYKRTTDHCIAELNGCLTPGAWLKSSCLAGCFFQESLRINFPGPALGWSVGWTATRYGEKLPVCDGSDGNLAWSLLAAQLTVLTILTFLA